MAIALLAESFTATGQSMGVAIRHDFNLSLSGFGTATISLERSFDEGSTWKSVKEYTADIEERGFEPEDGILYRLNCTAYTSGTIMYRVSQ